MRRIKINPKITNRNTLTLDKYLADLSKMEMISLNEEVELAKLIKDGDGKALDLLVCANLRFVVSVAKQYQNRGLSLPDLINEGNLGLIKAAQRFDETRGFKFISYAVWWIRQSIIQALSSKSRLVRLPANKSAVANRINGATNKLSQQLEREPSPEEVAELIESSPELAKDIMRASQYHVSMDAPLGGDESGSLHEKMDSKGLTQPDNELMADSLKDEIERVLSQLSEREYIIIVNYFGLSGQKPENLEAIGLMVGLTKERVRQIKDRALRKLKIKSSRELLRNYLGN